MRAHVLVITLCLGCNDKPNPIVTSVAPSPAPTTATDDVPATDEVPAGKPATPSAPPAEVKIPTGVDWPSVKRVSTDVDVEGIGVSLDVPEGLPRDPRTGDWNISLAAADELPKVVLTKLEADRITDADKAKYHATLSARSKTWVRTDQRPDGWALTNAEPDKTHIEAIRYLRSGENFVRCKASQLTEAPIPNHGKALTMLESICDSMKLR